ncbi:translation initiation factor IF-2-like [Cuculus canorus]|uniref:translation initiation factor IF-2-like n=1 Tax=Cuculus canorus TaxID=55661 RepID=UPI0023AA3139|nr:translation initiation factor IF-2-like [Cuculus canorus]XP_053915001.1 translation initiation factor IF-2-like [Cuculus canorus]
MPFSAAGGRGGERGRGRRETPPGAERAVPYSPRCAAAAEPAAPPGAAGRRRAARRRRPSPSFPIPHCAPAGARQPRSAPRSAATLGDSARVCLCVRVCVHAYVRREGRCDPLLLPAGAAGKGAAPRAAISGGSGGGRACIPPASRPAAGGSAGAGDGEGIHGDLEAEMSARSRGELPSRFGGMRT